MPSPGLLKPQPMSYSAKVIGNKTRICKIRGTNPVAMSSLPGRLQTCCGKRELTLLSSLEKEREEFGNPWYKVGGQPRVSSGLPQSGLEEYRS